eukprot:PITA_11189
MKEAVDLEGRKLWEEAMVDEMASLHKNEAWDMVELSTGRKPIGSKWLLKKKTNAEGKVEKYKAQLVAKETSPLLVGFIDSDWVGDPNDWKSIAGYVFTLGSRPITWACKKKSAISISSVEGEYRAIVEASKEDLWLRQILSKFGFHQQYLTKLWFDNQSAIQLCKVPVQHQCSKQIELHMHFIIKLIHNNVLEVQYCSTDDQVANIFRKALTEAKFIKLQFMVGV